MKDALDEADANGYGIVYPQVDKMSLNEPEMVKQGNIYGVRLKATSPSYHIVKVDVATEVSPMVGTEQQSKYLLDEYKQNPQAIWNTNMFGKTMAGLAKEGLEGKCSGVPVEIMGLGEVPSAGDTFAVVEDEKLARELVQKRKFEEKEAQFNLYQKVTL
ncbi:MAG: hypothetical protein OSJ68_09635, partial [Clostridia bacterium]|nr:hypothetical protein [Clostridia bacterium]